MIWKILSFLVISIGGYFLFRRAGGAKGSAVAAARGKSSEEFVECPHCGGYRSKSEICDCQRIPTL